MTNILSKYTKKFAIIASILMLTMIAVPMVAAEYEYEYGYYDEAQSPTPDITLSDLCGAEIEMIDGLPFIVTEVEYEYINIPVTIFDTKDIMIDGMPTTVEVDGNYLLIPTKYEIERICISEFDVKIINGDLTLVREGSLTVLVVLTICAMVVIYAIAPHDGPGHSKGPKYPTRPPSRKGK